MSSLRFALFSLLLSAASCVFAQDGTIYPLPAPAEPNAIPLGTGGVDQQPARESWFRQWGQPMARNITTATLTPFLPAPGKGNGAAVLVAPGGGFRWLALNHEGWAVAQVFAGQSRSHLRGSGSMLAMCLIAGGIGAVGGFLAMRSATPA